LEFKDVQKLVYPEYQQNGFEAFFNKHDDIGDIAEIGLVSSEVGEALDYCREKEEKFMALELADIVIRVFNFCNRKGIDLESFIIIKNRINKQRTKYHGKKVI